MRTPRVYSIDTRHSSSTRTDAIAYFDVTNFSHVTITNGASNVYAVASNSKSTNYDDSSWTTVIPQSEAKTVTADLSNYKYLAIRIGSSVSSTNPSTFVWS